MPILKANCDLFGFFSSKLSFRKFSERIKRISVRGPFDFLKIQATVFRPFNDIYTFKNKRD